MTDYEHPRHPARHEPTIVSGDLGARVSCVCGWWTTSPSPARAAERYADHERDAR